jgi:3-oxoacyl-[acyl-carrier-protein] synthase III
MIPEEKWLTNLYSRGNTGGASISLMLKELFNSDKLQPETENLLFRAEKRSLYNGIHDVNLRLFNDCKQSR